MQRDHNLTSAVTLMATCFIEHTPGFELGESADAKSAISLVTELEDVYIQVRYSYLWY